MFWWSLEVLILMNIFISVSEKIVSEDQWTDTLTDHDKLPYLMDPGLKTMIILTRYVYHMPTSEVPTTTTTTTTTTTIP